MLQDGGKFEKLLEKLDEVGNDKSQLEALEKWKDTTTKELIK